MHKLQIVDNAFVLLPEYIFYYFILLLVTLHRQLLYFKVQDYKKYS